jgi:lipopolysaccharide biosynthesis glycosyltransferase
MQIYIGFDPRETAAFAVTRESARHHSMANVPIYGLVLEKLREKGIYTRPTEKRLGRLYDVISEHEMATEFAISRFLVPYLAMSGWAMFMDCDMLVRGSLGELWRAVQSYENRQYAVMCVKHEHEPTTAFKMDNQIQSTYARKNWSSVMLFNCDHPANKKLTPEMVNSVPGRDLHRFCWLEDEQIGALGPEWNYLVGHTQANVDPKIVHYTDGGPWFSGFENVEYAQEWNSWLYRWGER